MADLSTLQGRNVQFVVGVDADSGQSDDSAIGEYLESLGLNVRFVNDNDVAAAPDVA
ncbi:MAG: hypothetical protein OXF94_02770 [Gammaproteobacteria bacterium]|nr:hypothetical protein [Gammaproteobacteria bacterium]